MDSVRRSLVLAGAGALAPACLSAPSRISKGSRMPVLYVGHCSPVYAMTNGPSAVALKALGEKLRKPRAILIMSAHWITESGTAVQCQAQPATQHDFNGYKGVDPFMFTIEYPALGEPQLARKVVDLLTPYGRLSDNWAYDHGAWLVLRQLFPGANIPVVQLSVDIDKSGVYHYNCGVALNSLRDDDVLIIGSGNLVHNRQRLEAVQEESSASQSWAQDFDESVQAAINTRDDAALVHYHQLPQARMAVPHPDHYWPFIFALGAAVDDGPPSTFIQGFQHGTTSLRSFFFGTP